MPLDGALPAAPCNRAIVIDGVAPRLAALAHELASLAERLDLPPSPPEMGRQLIDRPEHVSNDSLAALLALALAAIHRRTVRNSQFRPALFADPAWDMLLDLFVSRLRQRQVCVSSLCIAARVPPTTALRWIRNMEAHGEIVRRRDPHDGRRILVEISDAAFDAVARTLQARLKRSSS